MLLTDNLISYYKLDGNANDEQGSHNGSITGATYTASGKINGCYSFDGNDYITTFSPGFGNNSWSISVWFKTSTSQSEAYIVGEYGTQSGVDYFVLRLGLNVSSAGANKLSILLRSSANESTYPATISSGAVNDGNWHHCVLVVNRSTNQVLGYLDGSNTLTGSRSFGGNFNGSLSSMALGRENSSATPGGYYTGLIDEVGFWNRALTSDEVTKLYNNGLGFPYPFLEDAVKTNWFM